MTMATTPTKDARIDFRINADVKEKLQQAATQVGVSLSSFVIQSAVERADDVLLRNKLLELSHRDQEALVQELLEPSKPNEVLIAAFRARGQQSEI